MIYANPIHTITEMPKTPFWSKRRITLTLATIILTPFLIAFIAGATVGILRGMHENPIHPATSTNSAQVKEFNDGFQDSKRDDCQQGSQFACDWLNNNLPKN